MFKFNGGAGAIICEVCRIIVRAPADRPTRRWGSADLCVACGEQMIAVKLTRKNALVAGRALLAQSLSRPEHKALALAIAGHELVNSAGAASTGPAPRVRPGSMRVFPGPSVWLPPSIATHLGAEVDSFVYPLLGAPGEIRLLGEEAFERLQAPGSDSDPPEREC